MKKFISNPVTLMSLALTLAFLISIVAIYFKLYVLGLNFVFTQGTGEFSNTIFLSTDVDYYFLITEIMYSMMMDWAVVMGLFTISALIIYVFQKVTNKKLM